MITNTIQSWYESNNVYKDNMLRRTKDEDFENVFKYVKSAGTLILCK